MGETPSHSDRHLLFRFWIDGEEIDLRDYFQEFTHTYMSKTKDRGAELQCGLVLMDTEWVRLVAFMAVLRRNPKSEVRIRYGWGIGPDGNESASPDYQLKYVSCEPNFSHEGLTLKIIFVPDMDRKRFEPKTWVADGILTPSDIVREVCEKAFKYQELVIEETKPIPGNLMITAKESANIDTLSSWISNTFCSPQGPRKEFSAIGKYPPSGHIKFRKRDGKGVIRFCSDHYDIPTQNNHRVYCFAQGASGNVLSFAPKDYGPLTAVLGGGNSKLRKQTVNKRNKTLMVTTVYGEAVQTTYVDGNAVSGEAPPGYCELPFSFVQDPDGANSRQQIIDTTKNYWQQIASVVIEADMEIIGDPTVQFGEYVNVIVLMPDGSVFPLSGWFKVIGLEHTLNGSGYTTKLNMVKQGSAVGIS